VKIEDVQKIKEIEIQPIKPINGLVAFASCIYDDAFYFGSIGIYTRPEGGYRLTFPTKKLGGISLSIYHPINQAVTILIEETILNKYEEIVSKSIQEMFE
jgi:DNA-binding cell septation regulator SpoVG